MQAAPVPNAVCPVTGLSAARSPHDVSTANTPKPGQLLVSSIRPEKFLAIYEINPLSPSEPKVLNHGTGYPKYPTYTPDGKWLIFSSETHGKTYLFIKSAFGDDQPIKLTNSDAFEGQSVVSSDGFIYFTSNAKGKLDIYRAKFTPGETVRMEDATNLTQGLGSNFSPAISPDGKTLAFTSNRHSTEPYPGPQLTPNYKAGAVYFMPAEGGTAKQISSGVDGEGKPAWQGSPVWSKDGKKLTFYAVRADQKIHLYQYDLEQNRIAKVQGLQENGMSLFPTMHPAGGLVYSQQKHPDKRWKVYANGEKFYSLKGQHCWGIQFRQDGTFAVNVTQKEDAPYLIEKRENPQAEGHSLNTVRGLFPIKEGDTIYAIDDMAKITVKVGDKAPKTLVEPVGGVFGLSKVPGANWLLTTFGAPFQSTPAHIYKVSINESSSYNLSAKLGGRNVFPSISFDGKRVVFTHQKEGSKDKQLYLTDANGSFFKPLTFDPGVHTMATISRDGTEIVYAYSIGQEKHYRLRKLYLNEDGSPGKSEDITADGTVDTHPVFSPDGKTIAFASNRGGLFDELPVAQMLFNPQPDGDVYIKLADDTEVRVTATRFEQATPSYTL